MKDLNSILEENRKRRDYLHRPYNPFTGEGSPIPRTMINLHDFNLSIYLPDTMLKIQWVSDLCQMGSVTEYCKSIGYSDSLAPESDLMLYFIQERFKHDFEFWAATAFHIQDAETLEEIPLILNSPQRKTLSELEEMRVNSIPIRLIIVKARQWGGSTLTQAYAFWIQQVHKENWHMAVCAQGDDAAKNINGMYTRAAESYPKELGSVTLKSYERSPKNRICQETGGIIGVGSYLNPNQFRSYNYPMIHISEVGLWEDTLKRKAAKVAQSLRNAVKYVPYSMVILESTANGIGNFFHNEWISATTGKSRYKPVFVGWWEIEMYQAEIVDYDLFVKNMTDYDWFLWGLGATLEGINWYNLTKNGENKSDWEMNAEYPSTAEEAFQSTGHKYFNPAYIQALAKDVRPPMFVGDVFGDSRMGENALKNIRFEKSATGLIHAWGMPDRISLVKHRYAFFADIGGRSKGADWSVLRGIDRLWMIEGGDPEFILTFRCHMDQDLFAWKCAQICMAFAVPEIGEYPLLALEVNSLKKVETEGDHFLTVLNQIADYYPRLYIRNEFDKVGDEWVPKYGFATVEKTKTMILDAQYAASRERYMKDFGEQQGFGYVERDQRAINEMSWFEVKPNGSTGAVEGEHDDIEIPTAGCTWMAIEYMPKPFYVENTKSVGRTKKVNESTF